ncbi:hypothetical protein B0H11DRAFT_2235663 [Mycena galericulata]|nr:hypothetical protein B0H11DRAFT_1918042 [Mycena galericulata]KAJ7475358.1 hypothetical protein B0H11DRAFT_2235663 [Mycena galericulata]
MDEGIIKEASYNWPLIDYDQVATKTCETIGSLLDNKAKARRYNQVIPETPQRQRIVRRINAIVAERQHLAAKRVFEAQVLNDRLKNDMENIYQFLRTARRTPNEQFTFPNGPEEVLGSLASVRVALNAVEDMVVGNMDLDETEADSEDGDPDTTVY